MIMCNITFEVPKLSTFVFKKSSEKKYSRLYMVKSLKGFGWNIVGPAPQTVAQHYFTIHPYGSQSKHGIITQFCFNVGPASNTIDRH